MKQFISVTDAGSIDMLVKEALAMKWGVLPVNRLGVGLKLGMVFLNPSLRTRLSTEMAAKNLGMEVQVLNMTSDSWGLEFAEDVTMDGDKPEHVKEAAGVLGRYFDLIALRSFPGLKNKEEDDSEMVFRAFARYSGRPMLSMESATRHPLQSLADLITIHEHKEKKTPKVVLTWAPHVKPLPRAVSHSFAEWVLAAGYDLHIAHPPGLELDEEYTRGANITHDQNEALKDADFVYVKSWSKGDPYGELHKEDENWMLNEAKLASAPNARIMHCLPARRNVELSGALLDSPRSLVLAQAENRLWSAQVVLKRMIESIHNEASNPSGY